MQKDANKLEASVKRFEIPLALKNFELKSCKERMPEGQVFELLTRFYELAESIPEYQEAWKTHLTFYVRVY